MARQRGDFEDMDDYEPPRHHYHHARGGLRSGFGAGVGCVLGVFVGVVLLCAGLVYIGTQGARDDIRKAAEEQRQSKR